MRSLPMVHCAPIYSSGRFALLSTPGAAVRSGMVRGNRPDPLQALQQPTWLVVRNKHRQPLESREIAPGADLRRILQATRAERISVGWACDVIGRWCGFFFAERAGERVQVGIERYDPAGRGPRRTALRGNRRA